MDKKKLSGRISISRISDLHGEFIRIALEDETSGVPFLEVGMSLENMAQAVTGRGYVPCEFVLRGTELLGLRKEVKKELVSIPNLTGMSEENRVRTIKDHFAPFETEGWAGRVSDVFNWNNRVRGDEFMETFNVTFVRYVEMTNTEENSPAEEVHAKGPFTRPNGGK
jgi:hypothetical protein